MSDIHAPGRYRGTTLALLHEEGNAQRQKPAWSRHLEGLVAAGFVACLLIIGSSVLMPRFITEAQADASVLQFVPVQPTAGANVVVIYRSNKWSEVPELRLRVRIRTQDAGSYLEGHVDQSTVAALVLADDGSYRGRVRLPESVAYAAFSVEEPEGGEVDHNSGRLWELMIHAEDGQPTLASLHQRRLDFMGRDWQTAYETALRITDIYPEDPAGWAVIRAFETWLFADTLAHSKRDSHSERFAAFHDRLALRQDLPPETLSGMVSYAIQSEADLELVAFWSRKLESRSPDHPDVILRRESEAWRKHFASSTGLNADGYFEELEDLWATSGSRRRIATLVKNAATRAAAEGRPDDLMRWIDRGRAHLHGDPGFAAFLANLTVPWPQLWNTTERWLQDEIRWVESNPEAERSLTRTISEQEAANGAISRRLRLQLSRLVLMRGDTAAAVRVLEQGPVSGWDSDFFDVLARLRMVQGDTLGALRLLANVAAESPHLDLDPEQAVPALAAAHLSPVQWHAWVEGAREKMNRMLLSQAQWQRVDLEARVKDLGGEVGSLAEALDGRPGIVVYCGQFCEAALARLREVPEVVRLIEGGAVRLVAVTDGPSDTRAEQPTDWTDPRIAVYEDHQREVRRALGNWGFPVYYLLDAQGWNAFGIEGLRPSEIPSRLAALQQQAQTRR